MPTSFHDREQAFEMKFAHDEEVRFLAVARGDRLFACWAADRARLDPNPAELLVKQVLSVRDGRDHDQALLRYVGGFLSSHGAAVSDADLSSELTACRHEAVRQLTERPPDRSDLI